MHGQGGLGSSEVAAGFGPSGGAFVVVAVVAAAAALVAALVLWNRVRGHQTLKVAQRAVIVLVCQATAVAAAFAVVNHANAFFVTWSELWGAADPAPVTIQGDDATSANGPQTVDHVSPTGVGPTPAPSGVEPPAATPSSPPSGYTLADGVARTQVTGPASGVTGEVDVWTPPGYDPRHPGGYPVILALDGYPGQPIDAINGLALPASLPTAASAGQLASSIVVSATTNVDGKNWGCADSPGAPRVGTWLTKDVPALVARDFAVRPGARWAALGLSEGGWCAVRLALTNPAQFSAAISLSGGNAADAPSLTHSATDRHANDLRTLAARGTTPSVDLLLAASKQDQAMASDAQALQKAAGAGVRVDLELLDRGGHNWTVWQQMTPPALTWLGARWPARTVG